MTAFDPKRTFVIAISLTFRPFIAGSVGGDLCVILERCVSLFCYARHRAILASEKRPAF
jgi:hypothetical protein